MDQILKEMQAGRYVRNEDGSVLIPELKLLVQGVFRYNKRGEPEEYSENLVVNQGLDYIIGASMGGASSISSWYIAPFSGDVTVQASWTAATFTAQATEWTLYTHATRPAWAHGAVASGGIDNFAAKVALESTTDAQVIRGAALISASAKSATSGTLVAASRFPSNKNLDTGEILDVGYGLLLTAV